jgi:hypothetical protein
LLAIIWLSTAPDAPDVLDVPVVLEVPVADGTTGVAEMVMGVS